MELASSEIELMGRRNVMEFEAEVAFAPGSESVGEFQGVGLGEMKIDRSLIVPILEKNQCVRVFGIFEIPVAQAARLEARCGHVTLRKRDGFVVVFCFDGDGRRNDDHAVPCFSITIPSAKVSSKQERDDDRPCEDQWMFALALAQFDSATRVSFEFPEYVGNPISEGKSGLCESSEAENSSIRTHEPPAETAFALFTLREFDGKGASVGGGFCKISLAREV
jgi:hypothetical protein